jgi:hypothetical protein
MALLTHGRPPARSRVHRWRPALAAVLAVCSAAHADLAAETDLKTAFAYNFIVLSTWPANAPPILRFCVAGARQGMGGFQVLSGKSAGERTLLVESAPTPASAVNCQILYIPVSEAARFGSWLTAVAAQQTLTISDRSEAPGAMVNLRHEAGRIVFDVDARAASASGIGLSSQLIKLAAKRL